MPIALAYQACAHPPREPPGLLSAGPKVAGREKGGTAAGQVAKGRSGGSPLSASGWGVSWFPGIRGIRGIRGKRVAQGVCDLRARKTPGPEGAHVPGHSWHSLQPPEKG